MNKKNYIILALFLPLFIAAADNSRQMIFRKPGQATFSDFVTKSQKRPQQKKPITDKSVQVKPTSQNTVETDVSDAEMLVSYLTRSKKQSRK